MLARSAFSPRHKNSRKADEARRFPSHLKWLRGRPCILDGRHGHACEGRMEAMHIDHAGGKGMAIKVADYLAVPACSEAHRLYHQYAKASPHLHLWEVQS